MEQVLFDWIDTYGHDRAVAHQVALTGIPAMSPENGGQGECRKAAYIVEALTSMGIGDLHSVDAQDERVPEGYRPNIVARYPGTGDGTLWIMGHMDVVPAGDPGLWSSDPFMARVDGDRVYGRGTEDNQQAIVSMLLLAEALAKTGTRPALSLGLLFVADEECGSLFGMEHVLRTSRGLFRDGDMVIVPDSGAADGSVVEIAEKGILWLRVEVNGRQCHASTPRDGVNALYAAAEMILAVPKVAERFPAVDPLFEDPSTFTATRHEENVANVNTVPGKDVFYVDCRVLPCYSFGDVTAAFDDVFAPIAAKHGVSFSMSAVQNTPAAPATRTDGPVITALRRSIGKVLSVEPRCVGIGGGTVAAAFRRQGIEAAVWATQDATLHGPDEYSSISHMIGDAKVFADVLCTASGR